MSLKYKGDSWTKEREDQARGEKEPFFCLPHCLPARSLPLSSYLAVLPLTSSQRPLSFFVSFVALPPSHSLFTSFCLAGIYSDMIAPSSLHLPPSSLRGLYLSTFKHYLLLFPFISPPSNSFSPSLSKWLLRKDAPALCLSILILNESVYAPVMKACAHFL